MIKIDFGKTLLLLNNFIILNTIYNSKLELWRNYEFQKYIGVYRHFVLNAYRLRSFGYV